MRIRSIKPDFFKNDALAEVEPFARLLFIGLWCLADCDGRLEDRPRRIKADVFPYEDIDVDQLLDRLAQYGFIVRYTVDGVRLIAVPGFRKHQRITGKEADSPSLYPAPVNQPGNIGETSGKHRVGDPVAPHGAISATPASDRPGKHRGNIGEVPTALEGKGKEGKGREGADPALTSEEIASDPEARWPYERKATWAQAIARVVDSKIGKTNWPAWKRLVDLRGLPAVIAATESMPSVSRWPNRVEDALPPPVEAPTVDSELEQAAALIHRHGWQACRDAIGIGNVPDEMTLARALDCNRPALRKLLAHYSQQQGVA